MKGRSKLRFICGLLFFLLALPVPTYGTDGQIKLTQPDSFPIVINQAGSYVLTSNLVVADADTNAITIEADNVTLDLNGHTIQGPNRSDVGSGIYAHNRYNITIKNGKVWGFGFYGVYLGGNPIDLTYNGHRIEAIQVVNNGFRGIVVYAGTVINCIANSNNSSGIFGVLSTITNSTANNNGVEGIIALDSTITNCVANSNGYNGIWGQTSTITNSTANRNHNDGIFVLLSTITNSTAIYNSNDGISAYGGCRIEGNNLRLNGRYGLYLSSTTNYAIKNVASSNTSGNFYAVSGNYMPTTGVNANYGF